MSASTKYNPLSYWFLNAAFYHYLNGRDPWDPDFSYTFGYDDRHPYTLSLVYSNYGPNRLHPTKKEERFTRFEEGTFSLGWKFTVPRYFDLATLTKKRWKESFSITVKYTIYKWWYTSFTCYYYPP